MGTEFYVTEFYPGYKRIYIHMHYVCHLYFRPVRVQFVRRSLGNSAILPHPLMTRALTRANCVMWPVKVSSNCVVCFFFCTFVAMVTD